MKFLITNDDGIDVAGCMRCSKPRKILAKPPSLHGRAAIGREPRRPWHERVRIEPRGQKRQSGSDHFAIHGIPADCRAAPSGAGHWITPQPAVIPSEVEGSRCATIEHEPGLFYTFLSYRPARPTPRSFGVRSIRNRSR
jgi:hypothetical protein